MQEFSHTVQEPFPTDLTDGLLTGTLSKNACTDRALNAVHAQLTISLKFVWILLLGDVGCEDLGEKFIPGRPSND